MRLHSHGFRLHGSKPRLLFRGASSPVAVLSKKAAQKRLRSIFFKASDDVVTIPAGEVSVCGTKVKVSSFRCSQMITNGQMKRVLHETRQVRASFKVYDEWKTLLSEFGESEAGFQKRVLAKFNKEPAEHRSNFSLDYTPALNFDDHRFHGLGDDFPRTYMSAENQEELATALGCTLLSEAQFIRMAGGSHPDSEFGKLPLREIVCRDNNQPTKPAAVRAGPRNAFGIYHALGNLWIPLRDIFNDKPFAKGGPCKVDPVCSRGGKQNLDGDRVLSGGSWENPLFEAQLGYRIPYPSTYNIASMGCRFVVPQD